MLCLLRQSWPLTSPLTVRLAPQYESRFFLIATMRHQWLSLAIIMAFLFTYTIASPIPSGRDKVTRSHSSKSCTSNHGALGERGAPGNGGHSGPVGGRHPTSNVRTGP